MTLRIKAKYKETVLILQKIIIEPHQRFARTLRSFLCGLIDVQILCIINKAIKTTLLSTDYKLTTRKMLYWPLSYFLSRNYLKVHVEWDKSVMSLDFYVPI